MLVLLVAGLGGYLVWHAKQGSNKSSAANTATIPTPKTTAAMTDGALLTIKEWGVKIETPSPINGATYKQIGNYVYYFNHDNGTPCQEETTAQQNAFEAAFNMLRPID